MNVNTSLWLPQPSASLYGVRPEPQTEETSKEKQMRLEGDFKKMEEERKAAMQCLLKISQMHNAVTTKFNDALVVGLALTYRCLWCKDIARWGFCAGFV